MLASTILQLPFIVNSTIQAKMMMMMTNKVVATKDEQKEKKEEESKSNLLKHIFSKP